MSRKSLFSESAPGTVSKEYRAGTYVLGIEFTESNTAMDENDSSEKALKAPSRILRVS